MRRYPQFVVQHPKLVLMIWGFVLCAMGFLIVVFPQIKINPTFKSMIMTNDPDRAFDTRAKDTFGDDEIIVVAIENPSGVIQIPTLELIDRVTRAIKAVKGVRDVYSLTDSDNIRGQGGTLLTDDLITELPKTPEDLARISHDVDENPIYTGTIISADRKVASISVELARTHSEPKVQAVVTQQIMKIVADEEKASHTRIHITGFPVASYLGGNYMIHDMVLFGGVSGLVLLVVMWIMFRRWQAIAFTFGVAMCGVAVAYGTMSLLGVAVTMPLSAVMVFLMAIGMEYAIYVGYAYNQQILDELRGGHKIRDRRFMMSEGLRNVKGPVILSGVTTAVGFVSMFWNPVPDLAQMGLFLCIGTATLMVATLTLVPAIISLWPYQVHELKESQWLHRVIMKFTSSAVRRPMLHMLVMVAIIIVSAWGWTRLSAETDAMQYFKESSRVRQDEEFVRKRVGGTTYLQAVVVGPAVDAFKEPENLRKLEQVQAYALTLPHVTKVVAHTDHLKLMNRALQDGAEAQYKLPETRQAVEQYLLLHNEPDDFRLVIDSDYRETAMLVRLDTMSSTVLKQTERKLETKMRETFPPTFTGNVVGTTLLVHRAFDQMAGAMAQGLAIACALAWLIMFLFLRSAKLATLSLLPNILPIGMNYAVLGFIGHPIDPPAAVTGAIALGIAVDDTTHMFSTWVKYRRNGGLNAVDAVTQTMREVGQPMVMSSTVLGFGFAVIMFSQYGTLVWMGIMLSVVAINGLLWDLLVSPALLRLTTPGFKAPSPKEMEAIKPLTKTKLDIERRTLAEYSDDEVQGMMVYDFFALAGKTVIRQGGRYGTRRLLYELEIKPGAKVLEFGAGIGANAFTLVQDYKCQVSAVDFSTYMVAQSERRAKELGIADVCKFVHNTEDRLPFDDNTFDVVLAEAVVMYTRAAVTLAEIFRVLKPGGKIGFHDWSWMREPDTKVEQLACVVACGCNIDDLKWYPKKGWEEQLQKRGFDVAYSEEHPFNYFTWGGMVDDEGRLNVLKMFGRILGRKAARKKMMQIMLFLNRYEGTFGYVIMVAKKPEAQPPAPAPEAPAQEASA